jgi:hypothetical protein
MSRTGATLPRGKAHVPVEDPDAPRCCTCRRPLGTPNDMHVDHLPDVDPAIAREEARRLGERDLDD